MALGSVANILINIAFDPLNFYHWWAWSEFAVAIFFCGIITETNRLLEKKIEQRYSWTLYPIKRFFSNLFLLTLTVVFVITFLGNLYLILIGDSFYNWAEMMIINLLTFFVALLLTIFKWTLHFFQNWKNTQVDLAESNRRLVDLHSGIQKMDQNLVFQKGSKDVILRIKNIRIALLEFGILKVYTKDGDFYIFQGSISKLGALLPDHFFFPVSRTMIIHRDSVLSLAPSTYGKILVEVQHVPDQVLKTTVSRLKAASFRSWYHGS